MKPNAIVLAGYYGFGNAGDELILQTIVAELRRDDPNLTITVLSRRPKETATRYQVLAVNRWRPWAWVGPLRRAQRFWLGGGGLLQESTGPWNHLYYLGLIVLAKSLGCRTALHAIGVDPTEHWLNRYLSRWVVEDLVDQVSVRDDESHRALRKAGVRREIDVVRDPIFEWPMPHIPAVAKRFGLALAPWRARPTFALDVAGICDRLARELALSVRLFAFFPAQDAPIAAAVVKCCKTPVALALWENPAELPDQVAACEFIVGMRYHALALGALTGRGFVGWGFQRKVRDLCRQKNQPFYSFENGWNPHTVFEQIRVAYQKAALFKEA